MAYGSGDDDRREKRGGYEVTQELCSQIKASSHTFAYRHETIAC